jgi:hypothetical protein
MFRDRRQWTGILTGILILSTVGENVVIHTVLEINIFSETSTSLQALFET